MFYVLLYVHGVLVASIFVLNQAQSSMDATVYINQLSGAYSIKFGVIDKENGVAYGTYDDKIIKNGWGELNIVAGSGQKPYSDIVKMHAAGYLEGALTAKRINQHYENTFGIFFKGKSDPFFQKATMFLSEQEQWMRDMIIKESETSSFWKQMGNIVAQYDGLLAGYQAHPQTDKPLSSLAFQIMNALGDLIDLKEALVPEDSPDYDTMTEDEVQRTIFKHGHCSVLIKVLAGYENIFAAHASWFHYSTMLRIYKHYNINNTDSSTSSINMSFSSYPGLLSSLDDFYIMDSGLILLQTTNNVYNKTLYNTIRPQSLLAWHRVRLANLMTKTGKEWSDVISQFNSGTYNNQYMILDLKRVELNKTLHDGALWVVEQIPTYVESGDQTSILRYGYWPSYNIPFYEKVYNLSGYPEFVKKHGITNSYEMAPRAKIFRQEQNTVRDLRTIEILMRYNGYQFDPYSLNSSIRAICSRGDLLSDEPVAFGCTDAKVTDYNMAKNLTSYAVNGPTYYDVPPFRWSEHSFPDKHVGMPDLYNNYKYVMMKPKSYATRRYQQ
ncbi:phospholipase B-like 1 [Exaiptasia diaphana]|uniref:Phospholipase B-like n=1 Tax=Exaiptasia diaphana TaxID=2652724 RepID=A0A913XGP7_EXADI|nr:phospholipase B-like 1 [Exaiptasia diaphana]